jgi:hypothetical protein
VTYTEATVAMKQYPNPLVASPVTDQGRPTTTTGLSTGGTQPDATCQTVPLGMIQPDSWWNPASWSWGKILGNTWSAIWNNCLSGAVKGTVGTASGALIVNLILRGGKVFLGPEGYAAIAISGCVVDLLW